MFLDDLLVHNEPLFLFGVDLIDVEEFRLILCIEPLEIFHLGHLADQSTLLSLRSQLHRRQLWPYVCHIRTFPSFASISFNIELSMLALQVSRHHRSSAFQLDVSFPNI